LADPCFQVRPQSDRIESAPDSAIMSGFTASRAQRHQGTKNRVKTTLMEIEKPKQAPAPKRTGLPQTDRIHPPRRQDNAPNWTGICPHEDRNTPYFLHIIKALQALNHRIIRI
jgi:hypothetical protein